MEENYYLNIKSEDSVFIKILTEHALEMLAEEFEEKGDNSACTLNMDAKTQQLLAADEE